MNIVGELRNGAYECEEEGVNGWGNTMTEAANEIERLSLALAKCVNRSDLPKEVERIALGALAPKEPSS